MQRKRRSRDNMLNVRDYIDWVNYVAAGYKQYGACPAIDREMAKLHLVGRAIIRAHDATRREGNRKDIYVGTARSA